MRNYTLRYSKSGIMQYATFITNNDILVNPTFSCAYQRKETLPDVTNCKTIEEVIKIIAEYSYDKICEIWMLDGNPIGFTDTDSENINTMEIEFSKLIQIFYKTCLQPLLPKECTIKYENICIEDQELKDIEEYRPLYNMLNYICYKFLYSIGIVKYNDFKSEVRYIEDYTSKVISIMEN